MKAHNRVPGGLLAMFLAGPLFMVGLALGDAVARWPAPIAYVPDQVWPFLGISLVSIPFGMVLSLLPILLGVLVMSWLGGRFSAMRGWPAWMLGGCVVAIPIVTFWGGDKANVVGIALIFTCAICARIARLWVRWTPDDQRRDSVAIPAVAISACPPK